MLNKNDEKTPDFEGALKYIDQLISKLCENQNQVESQTSNTFDSIKEIIKKDLSQTRVDEISISLDRAKGDIENSMKNIESVSDLMKDVKKNVSEIEMVYGVKREIQNQILSPVKKTMQSESWVGIKYTIATAALSIVISTVIACISFVFANSEGAKITARSTEAMLKKIDEKNIEATNAIASSGYLIIEKIGAKYEEVSGRLENQIKHGSMLTELLRLQTQVLSGNRADLYRIAQYSISDDFPFRDEAKKIILQIRRHFSLKALSIQYAMTVVDWNQLGIGETEKLSFDQMRKIYLEIPVKAQLDSAIPNALCDYILFKRKDFTMDNRTRFAIEVIKSDLNLNSVVSGQRFLMHEYNLQEYSLDFDGWVGIGKQAFAKRFPNQDLEYATQTSQVSIPSIKPFWKDDEAKN